MPKLNAAQISAHLPEIPEWELSGDTLVRETAFPDFAAAMRFVNQVAKVAEAADHHPDIDIRYTRVRLSLTSHDSGGITQRDLKLAAKISALSGANRSS